MHTTHMPLAAGTRLDSFEIVAPLGTGGMGEVYRARDTTLKRDVAIKVLPDYWSRDPERLRRFELEAQAAAALTHPNIVSIFHVGRYDGSPYIVTELLHGETLRERLRRGPMRLREVIEEGVELARGLAAAYDAGIVHRDLKPENIFITKDGRIKILDVGLAKVDPCKSSGADGPTASFQQQTSPGHMLGTVGYMSPEQVRGHAADARSDIFAAGAVLYEMLTGKPAFRKATSAETMSAILNEDPPPVSQAALNLPPGLQKIVNRCLAKNPEQRFQHAADLAFALEALSDSGGSSSHDVQQQPSATKWIWIAAAVAVIAIAAIALVWFTRPPAVPVVEAVTQLTEDGVPKSGSLLTDGSRLFFNEASPGKLKIAQVSVSGGETSVIPTSLANPLLAGIAADGSFLLSYTFDSPVAQPLWTIPLPTGEPRRFGTVESQTSSWYFPDGRVTFGSGTGLYVAEKDGSSPRKLLTASGLVGCPRVSPDGNRIVFATATPTGTIVALYQASAEGSGAHEILRSTQGSPTSCAYWTADGEHLIYRIIRAGMSNIWALPVHTSFLHRNSQPIQLTNGPLSYDTAVPSRDGNRVFAIGRRNRGELVRFDMHTEQFVPFMGGISAIDPTFSRDGQWVAYTMYADHTLWRSRADGTQRLQLTFPPMEVSFPGISLDGRHVTFMTSEGEQYVVSVDGGSPRRVDLPSDSTCASPAENAIVFTGITQANSAGEKTGFDLKMLDPQSGTICLVPSSQGIFGGIWIGQGKLVAAKEDSSKLLMFDFNSGHWTELVSGSFANWMPSPDGRYLYYATRGDDPQAMRIRLADRHVETITSLKNLHRVVDNVDGTTQIGVAPDGSPIFTRDLGTQEIYELTVKWR